jgi:hypothetical protein
MTSAFLNNEKGAINSVELQPRNAIAQNTLDQSMPKDLAWLLHRQKDAIFVYL